MPGALTRSLVVSLLVVLTTTLYADYQDSFRRGIQARNRSNFAEMVRFMRLAISEQAGETGERINISGMDFVPYLPHFFLGLGLFSLGDCTNALAAWQQSESQGAIQRFPQQSNTLTGLRRKCEARIAAAGGGAKPPVINKPAVVDKPVAADKPVVTDKPAVPDKPAGPDPAAVNAAVQTAAAAISRAEEAGRAVDQLRSDALLGKVWTSDAALGAADQRAQASLSQARTELEAGRRESNLARLQQAATVAGTAQQVFDGVRQAGQTRREELQRASVAVVPVRPIPGEGGTTPAANPTPAAVDPVKPGTTPPPLLPTTTTSTTTNTGKPFVPPPALTAAARLFFGARYQEASASLSALRYDAGPAAAQVALLRAAADYSLYLIGGERDARLLEQARQAVAECRRFAPALRPDSQAFSPRFVEFFTRVTP